jgi:phage N-6-adenine-methyltransferase
VPSLGEPQNRATEPGFEMELAAELTDELNGVGPATETQLGTFTDTGWVPPSRDLTDDELLAVPSIIRRRRDGTNWQWGDWLAHIERVRGETFAQFADHAQVSVEHVKNCKRVAEAFPIQPEETFAGERFERGRLPWHATRVALLIRAEHGDGDGKPWTRARFRTELRNLSEQPVAEEAKKALDTDASDQAEEDEADDAGPEQSPGKPDEPEQSRDFKTKTNSGDNEWFTPPEILKLARDFMGGFDLDPASSEAAQKNVQAAHFFDKDRDGLTQEWWGKVWMNPPYSRALMSKFVDKLLKEMAEGRVIEAIVLTHNFTDTAWFHSLGEKATRICFPRGRIKFLSPTRDETTPTSGQAFFYFGRRGAAFERVFEKIGLIR